MGTDHQPHIAFLIGKPLHLGSVIAEVIQRLHREVPMITVVKPAHGHQLPALVFECDLVVQRGLRAEDLNSLIQVEVAGVRCINSALATRDLGNRGTLMSRLDAAGLPIPHSVSVHSWQEIIEVTGKRPVAIKALDGSIGRGLLVLLSADGNIPAKAPFDGPFIVQEYIPSNATVRKLYIVGTHMRGLLKNAGTSRASQYPGVPIDIDSRLADLASLVGIALGIEIYGVDVLIDLDGRKIIDVNPFPSFRNVPDAARLVANHLSEGMLTSKRKDAPSNQTDIVTPCHEEPLKSGECASRHHFPTGRFGTPWRLLECRCHDVVNPCVGKASAIAGVVEEGYTRKRPEPVGRGG